MSLDPKIEKAADGTFWLRWTPDATAEGYAFVTPGGASRTFDPTKSQAKLGKNLTEPVVASVAVLDVTSRPSESASYPPVVIPPPDPTGFVLGFCGNSGFPGGNMGPNAATLGAKGIRVDNSLSDATVAWAAQNGVEVMGLGSPLTMATVDRYPSIGLFEYWNEPYFIRPLLNLTQWATDALTFAKAFKAKYPNKKLILPMYCQENSDKGDYPVNGNTAVWKPWATQLLDAQPTLRDYFDGWGAHPYSTPNPPSFATLDKVRGQLVGKGFNHPCYVTEIGWAVSQVGEAKQAEYLDGFLDGAKTRSWIKAVYVYCLSSWNDSDKEGSFGMFRPNGTARPSAATFRSHA